MAKRFPIGSFVVLACALSVGADTVRYSYDEAARLIRVEYPGGEIMTYTYDAAGNLLERTVTAPAAASAKGFKVQARAREKTRRATEPQQASR